MTSNDSGPEAPKKLICGWCGQEFVREGSRGPDPKYCSDGHKQRAYEARRASIPAAGPEHDVWVAAIDIAVTAPTRLRNTTTLIPSEQIETLRDRLDACGVEWAKGKEAKAIQRRTAAG